MLEIIKSLPIYVYAIFGFVVFRALKNLKERDVKLSKIMVLPILFIALNISNILGSSIPIIAFIIFIICFPAGIYIGSLFLYNSVKTIKIKANIVTLPSSVFLCCLILFKFIFSFFIGYNRAVNPDLFNDLYFLGFIMIVSTITTGIFYYRCFYILKNKKNLMV